jgi:CHASE3 domain sensor protein
VLSKKLLIGHRIGIGFAVPLVALLLIGTFSLRNLQLMREEAAWVTHTVEVMAELKVLTGSISRLESAGRGYVISSDEKLKAELEMQSGIALGSLGKLRALTADNPSQQTRFDKLGGLIARRTELSRQLVAARENDPTVRIVTFATLVRQCQVASE